MPVYNGAKFVREAIESILAQSFSDIELIVVDDCSSDETVDVVRAITDPRLRLIELSKNSGPSEAMNVAIRATDSEYVARIDGDDLAYPERVSEQVRYLDSNPTVGIVSSFARIIGHSPGVWELPSESSLLRATLTFYNPICHSTVVIRRSAIAEFDEPYDPSRRHGEDYDVYLKVSHHHGIACIPKHLAAYRKHQSQVSGNKDYAMLGELDPLFVRVLSWIGVEPSAEQLRLHRILAGWGGIDLADLVQIESWLRLLNQANRHAKVHPSWAFALASANRLYDACLRCDRMRPGFLVGLKSPLIRRHPNLSARLALRAAGVLKTHCVGAGGQA